MAGHTSSPAARSRAVTKFIKEKYDRIELRYTKESGEKQAIMEHAARYNEDVSTFIKRAISETIENDNKKLQ